MLDSSNDEDEQDWSNYLIEMLGPGNDEDEASDSSVRQLSLYETDSSAGERLSIDLSIDEYSDLEHQAYADDFRLIIPNGWGLYEVSLEGGHQLAESQSISPSILELAFVEDSLNENDSARYEDN